MVTISYNANIPLVTDKRAQSQAQIRANFQAIASTFDNNHASLTGDQPQGMHNVITLRPQAIDPTTAATETAIYNKLVSTLPQIFFAPSNAQTPIQMTYSSVKADMTNTQRSFVAGPFIVYSGLVTNPTNGQLVTLTPGSQLIYVDLTTANPLDGGKPITGQGATFSMCVPTTISGTSFNISYASSLLISTRDVYYVAIGLT